MRGEIACRDLSAALFLLRLNYNSNASSVKSGMLVTRVSRRRPCPVLIALLVIASIGASEPAPAATCDFAPVRQQIDTVLDKDPAKFAIFRKEVSEGADPIAMMEKLVAEDTRKMLDICRYEVDQYLAKRGFAAFH